MTVEIPGSPGLLALQVSEGRWKMARHLAVLDKAITDAVFGYGPDRLIVTMPPRHGKSELCSKFTPAWYVSAFPDNRVILTSYEADYAAEWGRKSRAIVRENSSLLGVDVSDESHRASRWNIQGRDGGMVTAGVGGAITGRGANLLIVDDPVKNAEQADSPTYRRKAVDWWHSTAETRLEPGAVVIVVQTRWHEDDLAGYLQREEPDAWHVINFPALAEEEDILGRKPGDALWPWRYSTEALTKLRDGRPARWFSALYQQRPVPLEGGMFHAEWLSQFVDMVPSGAKFVRYWDKAGTAGGGDYTVGALLAVHGGNVYVVDIVRGQWSSGSRNDIMRQTAELDELNYGHVQIWAEQEPGSGGKESAEITVRELSRWDIRTERVTGHKEDRARPFAAQCEMGNVYIVRGKWNSEYISELLHFGPGCKNDDQVDATSGAYNKLKLTGPRTLSRDFFMLSPDDERPQDDDPEIPAFMEVPEQRHWRDF